MGAFSAYKECTSLEQAIAQSAKTDNPTLVLTRGIEALFNPAPPTPSAAADVAAPLTLPDGRLNAGTHLGVLARRYRYLSRLGEGVSSQALLVEDTFTPGEAVVLKAMHRQYAYAGQREARTLRFLHSRSPSGAAPGVVRLLDTFTLGSHHCLVTERLYPRLLDWIADSAQQAQQEALAELRKLAHQLLVCLAFLQQQGVVHADIKPDNLLFTTPHGTRGMGMRLVDFGGSFGISETDTQRLSCEVQTLQYRAPEAVLRLPYGAPIDLWSAGVVLAEAALKQPLLRCRTPVEAVQAMEAVLGPLPRDMLARSPLAEQLGSMGGLRDPLSGSNAPLAGPSGSGSGQGAAGPSASGSPSPRYLLYKRLVKLDPQLADLLLGLLRYDPAQRLTAAQALLHPFFDPLLPLRTLLPSLQATAAAAAAAAQSQRLQQRQQGEAGVGGGTLGASPLLIFAHPSTSQSAAGGTPLQQHVQQGLALDGVSAPAPGPPQLLQPAAGARAQGNLAAIQTATQQQQQPPLDVDQQAGSNAAGTAGTAGAAQQDMDSAASRDKGARPRIILKLPLPPNLAPAAVAPPPVDAPLLPAAAGAAPLMPPLRLTARPAPADPGAAPAAELPHPQQQQQPFKRLGSLYSGNAFSPRGVSLSRAAGQLVSSPLAGLAASLTPTAAAPGLKAVMTGLAPGASQPGAASGPAEAHWLKVASAGAGQPSQGQQGQQGQPVLGAEPTAAAVGVAAAAVAAVDAVGTAATAEPAAPGVPAAAGRASAGSFGGGSSGSFSQLGRGGASKSDSKRKLLRIKIVGRYAAHAPAPGSAAAAAAGGPELAQREAQQAPLGTQQGERQGQEGQEGPLPTTNAAHGESQLGPAGAAGAAGAAGGSSASPKAPTAGSRKRKQQEPQQLRLPAPAQPGAAAGTAAGRQGGPPEAAADTAAKPGAAGSSRASGSRGRGRNAGGKVQRQQGKGKGKGQASARAGEAATAAASGAEPRPVRRQRRAAVAGASAPAAGAAGGSAGGALMQAAELAMLADAAEAAAGGPGSPSGPTPAALPPTRFRQPPGQQPQQAAGAARAAQASMQRGTAGAGRLPLKRPLHPQVVELAQLLGVTPAGVEPPVGPPGEGADPGKTQGKRRKGLSVHSKQSAARAAPAAVAAAAAGEDAAAAVWQPGHQEGGEERAAAAAAGDQASQQRQPPAAAARALAGSSSPTLVRATATGGGKAKQKGAAAGVHSTSQQQQQRQQQQLARVPPEAAPVLKEGGLAGTPRKKVLGEGHFEGGQMDRQPPATASRRVERERQAPKPWWKVAD